MVSTSKRERPPNMVPGFPEIVAFTPRCLLCALAKDDPERLRSLHSQRAAGVTVKGLRGLVQATWPDTPDLRSFSRHFDAHVNLSADVDFAIPEMRGSPRRESDVRAAVEKALAAASAEEAEDASDFIDMRGVVQRMKRWVARFDDEAALQDDETGRLDRGWMVIAMKLSGELRASIEALNRMKNTERLTRTMLQGHTKRYTQHISPQLTAELLALRAAVLAGDVTLAARQVDDLLNAKLGLIYRQSADASVQESCDLYKLH